MVFHTTHSDRHNKEQIGGGATRDSPDLFTQLNIIIYNTLEQKSHLQNINVLLAVCEIIYAISKFPLGIYSLTFILIKFTLSNDNNMKENWSQHLDRIE